MLDWLHRPYPFDNSWPHAIRAALWAGFFVAFFLFVFKPFGTQVQEGAEWKFARFCLYFGLVTAATTLLVNAVCRLFPAVFDEEKWVVWKEILFNIVFIICIGCGNMLLAHFTWSTPLTPRSFLVWQGLTFAVGLFPMLIGASIGQMRLSKKYMTEAAQLSRHAPSPQAVSHREVVLAGDNQNETLRLDAAQIAWLSAADNYVQVFYFENDVLKSRMLRATLKKMEETLSDSPQFFRCHRTYVVNLEKVTEVSGNAQGYRLHIAGADNTVPVSRNLNEAIRQKLAVG